MSNSFSFFVLLIFLLILVILFIKFFSQLICFCINLYRSVPSSKQYNQLGVLSLKNKVIPNEQRFGFYNKLFNINFFSVLIEKKFGLKVYKKDNIKLSDFDKYYLLLLKLFVLKIKKDFK